MHNKLILFLTLSAGLSMAVSCNSSTSDEYEYVSSKSVAVTAFSLTSDQNVLDSLQNVFFAIDLVEARIWNADSLPYGTKISRLIPSITVVSTASVAELTYKLASGADSTVNYLTNSTDSIDFSNGPVHLRVVSETGEVERTYEIKVNVHTIKPDTLAWNQIQCASLPTSFANIDAQYTVRLSDKFYCLTSSNGSYCLAITDNPADPQWTVQTVNPGFDANLETLRATTDTAYMLDVNGQLYKSTDCVTWTATGQIWHGLYGAYGDQMLGSQESNGVFSMVSYPNGKIYELPAGFPIDGTSQLVCYDPTMAMTAQAVMLGGRDCTGALSADAWGFDGENLAKITKTDRQLPEGLSGMTLVEYDLFQVRSTNWKPVEFPALVAMGGIKSDGSINRTLYYSRDWGLTWRKAPDLMQLPDGVPSTYNASAYVYATTMHVSKSSTSWSQVQTRNLPPQCQWELPWHESRVIAPIDEWECPAIYVFGGRNEQGKTLNEVWRGLILRYTFAPKY